MTPRPSRTSYSTYAIALGSMVAAICLRLLLDPVLGVRFPFATLFLAVLVAAWYGGFRPAMAATLLGAALSVWFLLPPRYSWELASAEEYGGLALYLLISFAIGLVGQTMRGAWQRAEASSQQAASREEQWRVTLQSIGDGVISTDVQGRVTGLNPTAEALTGWTRDEAMGRPLEAVFQIVNEQTGNPVANPVQEVLTKGTVVGLANHTVLIARDGVRRPIDDSAAPMRDQSGQLTGVVLVFRDVSERRRVEIAHALMAAAVASSDDAIITKTLEGIITSWNAGAERLFGYKAEEIIGKPVLTLIPPDRQFEEVDILARLRRGERIEHYDTIRVTKDGRLLDISLTTSPVHDAHGRIIGASKVARDVTQRKQTELALAASAQALRDADRRKDEFLATLAHELRNPLAPVRNALEILKRAADDPVLLEQARETMDRQMSHLERLVDDLLDLSRITRDTLELRSQRVELASILHQALETCRPLVESMNHQLIVSIPPDPVYLDADSVRLAQVFSNLLNNACKYTDPGGRIELTATKASGQAVVSIKDNGLGIPHDMLPRIFHMFTQVDQSLERSQGGLGIGLTLVKRLVEKHAGTIEARSQGPGKGSEFIVRLPVATAPASPVLAAPHNGDPGSQRLRILVVDDNKDAATTLGMLLKLSGHEVSTAHDGEAAVAKAREVLPQIVLMDIGLPKLNGYEAARRIRSEPWGKDMVLIAATGWGQDEDRRKSEEAGFNHHLVKPINQAALQKLLAQSR